MSSASDDSTPCSLFAITQFECSPEGGRFTCWPLERVFRKCGNGPAIEVTNALLPPKDGETVPSVKPGFIAHPPRGKQYRDVK